MRTTKIDLTEKVGAHTVEAHLTVSEADLLISTKRNLLRLDVLLPGREEGKQGEKQPVVSDLDRMIGRYVKTVLYPDLMAATTGTLTVDGEVLSLPLDYDRYAHMPDCPSIESAWEAVVYELNPHWVIKPKTDESEAEKKASVMSSTPASPPSTRQSKGKKK